MNSKIIVNFKAIGVFAAMKKACEHNISINDEACFDDLNLYSHASCEDFGSSLTINYKISQSYISITDKFDYCIPADKLQDSLEMISYLNPYLLSVFVHINIMQRTIEVKAGMYVINYGFDKAQFEELIYEVQDLSCGLFGFLKSFYENKINKEEAWHCAKHGFFISDQLKVNNRVFRNMGLDLPFYVNPGGADFPMPAHSHGLAGIGMPEFIVDAKTYWLEDNAGNNLINRSYDYFICPDNSSKIDAILNGEIIRVARKDLMPESQPNDPHFYCFREVPPTFKAVKEAYEWDEITPGMRFIQIFAEGNDAALLDEYYPDVRK